MKVVKSYLEEEKLFNQLCVKIVSFIFDVQEFWWENCL